MGRVADHVEPTLAAMDGIRNQWANVRMTLETDNARIEQTRQRLRGADSAALAGNQGDAFDRTVERYRAANQRAQDTLDTLLRDMDSWVAQMREAAQQCDGNLISRFFEYIDRILDMFLPNIPVENLFREGEAAVHQAMGEARHSLLNIWDDIKDLAEHALEGAISGSEAVLSAMANTLQWCSRQWNSTLQYISGQVNVWLNQIGAALTGVSLAVEKKLFEDLSKAGKLGKLIEKLHLQSIADKLNEFNEIPGVQVASFVLNFLSDWGSGTLGTHSFFSDLAGNGISTLIGATEIGGIAEAIAAGMQLDASLNSVIEKEAARYLAAPGSAMSGGLTALSHDWSTTYSNLNLGGVFDDWGAVVVDGYTGIGLKIGQSLGLVSPTTWDNFVATDKSDVNTAFGATGNFVQGIQDFGVNTFTTTVADSAAGANFAIQRLPFPSAVKAVANGGASALVSNMSAVSNYVVNGKMPPNSPWYEKAGITVESDAIKALTFGFL